MTGLSAYKSTPRQVRKYTIEILSAGLVPFIRSSPGMGKSAIVRSIAEEYGMELLDVRLSTCAPEDLTGLPHFTNGTASFLPFDMFPIEDTPVPEGRNGWLLFLDEFNAANKSVQAAAYKLVLDRMVGLKKLHPQCMIVAAGNLDSDRAITHNIGTALQSRFVHLEMELNHKEFMEDVAFKQGWDSRIIAYLNYSPTDLHDFRPDHSDKTFSCPRTWEFVHKLIQGKEYAITDGVYEMDAIAPMLAGAITSGVAVKFINFTRVFKDLPTINQIVADPENLAVPQDPPVRYAAITYLISQANEKNFTEVTTYINRFSSEFRVLFFRGLIIQKPELRSHPAFRAALLELSRYLHD